MSIQGEKAANDGDILKHPLICDLLQKCIDAGWKNITYAETHAGAGIYSSKDQDPQPSPTSSKPKKTKEKVQVQHIKALFQKHEKNIEQEDKKDTYWHILNQSWEPLRRAGINPDTEIKYSGSAYLAASILKATNKKFDIRLTEYDPIECNRLKVSLTKLLGNDGYNFEDGTHIQQAGFQEKIGWLTANDNLVLIIDPFRLSIGSASINEGNIDLYHLLELTESVKNNKKNAIIGFWYSVDQNSIKNKMKLSSFFDKTLIENYGELNEELNEELNGRKYSFKTYHFILIGFGEGIEIVNNLPSQSELENRWFKLKITERLFTKRMKKMLGVIKDLKNPINSKEKLLANSHIENLKMIIQQIDNLEAETGNES